MKTLRPVTVAEIGRSLKRALQRFQSINRVVNILTYHASPPVTYYVSIYTVNPGYMDAHISNILYFMYIELST